MLPEDGSEKKVEKICLGKEVHIGLVTFRTSTLLQVPPCFKAFEI